MKPARTAARPFLAGILSLSLTLLVSPNAAVASESAPDSRSTNPAALQTACLRDTTETQNTGQRWYESVLRQQQIIAEQVDELRNKLNQDLMTRQAFLDGVSSLFERTDRLYAQWKKLGCPADANAAPQPTGEAAFFLRKDAAIGKSLNYLRLSLINFFLGYADSDGSQIAAAEDQVALSKAWRICSLRFIRALHS